MSDIAGIKEILPNYDSLPDMLCPRVTSELTGYTIESLAVLRCRGGIDLGFIRSGGRKILYPKIQVAKFLLKNTVGIGGAE